ncbi:MAG: RNase P subunit p30 family protein [archaeon]|nr:RNase P subunit p30 family protein [archaeon]
MNDLVFYHNSLNLNELIQTAKSLNTKTIILAKNFHSIKEAEELKKKLASFKFDFKLCHLMLSSNSKQLSQFKNKTDFVAVLGGNVELNKFAVSSKQIDFLLAPVTFGRLSVDTAIARIAAENEKIVIFLFSDFLNSFGLKRMQLFRNAFFSMKLFKKFKVSASIFSGAEYSDELRAVEDLSVFLELLGLNEKQARKIIKGQK